MKILIILLLGGLISCASTAAERIISAGGSITETIFALGKGNDVVATDSTSMFPLAAQQLPKLGYFRQLSIEGVLAQQPTHLIGANATGPAEMLQQLRAAGIQVDILGEDKSLKGLYQMITQLGELISAQSEAEQLTQQIANEIARLQAQRKAGTQKGLFILSNGDRGLTVAGSDTVPQALFDAAGIENAAANLSQYKVMDNEAIALANPDFVVLAGHVFGDESATEKMCQHPAIAATHAGRKCRVYSINSSIALGLSPRFPEALAQLLQMAGK